uniref:Uncharacterized protein n=1 Tax=Acetithermum autotrophicum TaxID=1446466 RepID=H5SUP7_ACEAU|nr:hypothetical protein HGMM_OP4C883 [Candidatus Acetothermum autotrophicum]
MQRAIHLAILGWLAIPVTLGRWLGRLVWNLLERVILAVKAWLVKG